jgi:AAA15 family ATPase/GTPase
MSSFGKLRELNMFPAPRFTRLKGHKYQACGMELLKLASLYGANGSGKSNLIEGIGFLRSIIVNGNIPSPPVLRQLKHFYDVTRPTVLAIEFIIENVMYLYALEIGDQNILREELYISGLGKKSDELVYERTTDPSGITTLQFFEEFGQSDEGKVLTRVLAKNLIKPNTTALKAIAELDNPVLHHAERAYRWFDQKLIVITPRIKPAGLPHWLDVDKDFRRYAEDSITAFDVGIKRLVVNTKSIEEFYGEDNKSEIEAVVHDLGSDPDAMLGLFSDNEEEAVIVRDGNRIVVKQLETVHRTTNGNMVNFKLKQESDGSRRLLEYLPVFKELVSSDMTYCIDELERSIHPLLIKEIIKKFSHDDKTKGQLIFTTHESNLLDQEIFRQDEIWFIEKDPQGCTDLYALSDFKEHNTKDIQKGYLTGRYGSIPFLANLQDLRWNNYDFKK